MRSRRATASDVAGDLRRGCGSSVGTRGGGDLRCRAGCARRAARALSRGRGRCRAAAGGRRPRPTRWAAAARPTSKKTTGLTGEQRRGSPRRSHRAAAEGQHPVVLAEPRGHRRRLQARGSSGSPSSTKMSAITRLAGLGLDVQLSVSRKAHGEPLGRRSRADGGLAGSRMAPTSTTAGAAALTGTLSVGEVGLDVAAGLANAVAAELLEHGVGEHQRDHRLGDDAGRGNGAHVRALVVGPAASPVATSTVRSARGTVAIGFIAARTRSTSPVVIPPSVPPARPGGAAQPGPDRRDDLVVGLRSRAGRGQLEAVAHLDALDRLDAHQRPGQPAVEAPVPVHVRAEAGRQAVHDHLDDAAEGVAVLAGGRRSRATIRAAVSRVEAAHRVGVDACQVRRLRARSRRAPRRAPSSTTWLRHRGAGTPAAGTPWRPRRARPGRRSPGRRPARGSGGPRRSRTSASRRGRRARVAAGSAGRCAPGRPAPSGSTGSAAITFCPLGPLGVADLDRHRAAQGRAVPHAADDARPRPARTSSGRRGRSPAGAAPGRARDVGGGHRDVGGQALEDPDEGGSVRLPRSQPSEHWPILSCPRRGPAGLRTGRGHGRAAGTVGRAGTDRPRSATTADLGGARVPIGPTSAAGRPAGDRLDAAGVSRSSPSHLSRPPRSGRRTGSRHSWR